MRGHAINHQTTWHSQGQGCCRCLLISPHNRVWKYHPPSQWSHDYLKGGWAGGYLCITCLWTCLPPPLVGPLMKLWRIQVKLSPNRKVILRGFILWYSLPSWWNIVPCLEIFMAHDECIGRWNPPPHHPKIFPYKHQSLHPLPLPYFFSLVPDEGKGVQRLGNFWGFGPMAGSGAHGSWHFVSSIFAIFAILQSMGWSALDYHNYIVFMNETGQKIPQVPFLMKNMMWKIQRLTYMLNIIYRCFHNQLISCYSTNYLVRANIR